MIRRNEIEKKGGRLWASLVGPLMGAYYPCPEALTDQIEFAVALNSSKLARLWCAVYTEAEVDAMIVEHRLGEFKLPEWMAGALDYDSYLVAQYRHEGGGDAQDSAV